MKGQNFRAWRGWATLIRARLSRGRSDGDPDDAIEAELGAARSRGAQARGDGSRLGGEALIGMARGGGSTLDRRGSAGYVWARRGAAAHERGTEAAPPTTRPERRPGRPPPVIPSRPETRPDASLGVSCEDLLEDDVSAETQQPGPGGSLGEIRLPWQRDSRGLWYWMCPSGWGYVYDPVACVLGSGFRADMRGVGFNGAMSLFGAAQRRRLVPDLLGADAIAMEESAETLGEAALSDLLAAAGAAPPPASARTHP